MSARVQLVRRVRLFALPATLLGLFTLTTGGCGTAEEGTETWDTAPTVSQEAKLQFQTDSLRNENRRMRDQLDAVAAENRNLTAKLADAESKLTEANAQQKAQPTTRDLPPPADMSSAYNAALASYRQKDYSGAIDQFQAILKGSPKDEVATNCHYWIGESKYGQKKYSEAIQSFESALGYTVSHKKDVAQLMIANSYYASGDKASAKEAYQKLISTYPASPLVQKAQDKMAKIK